MKTQMGWPSMQKNSQKDTFPNSLLYSFRCFESNFSKAMAGACIIMARKAQQLTTPRGTQTTYSWATADSTKTKKFAPNFDHPFLSKGVQQCLMKKKCTGRFHVFQYSSKFLQFHQSMQKLRSPNWMISEMMLSSRWKKAQKPMIHPMVLGMESLMRRQAISIQSPFPALLMENQAYSSGSMYCTHRTSSKARMTPNSTILLSSQGTLMGGDLGYSSWQHSVGAIRKQANLLRVISNCQSLLFFTIISKFSALISWLAKTNSLNSERASAADRSRMERISVFTCMQLISLRNSTRPKAVKSSPDTGLFFRKLAQQSTMQTSRVTWFTFSSNLVAESDKIRWNLSLSSLYANSAKTSSEKKPMVALQGRNSKGAFLNLAPYLQKLSTILRRLSMTNMIAMRLMNPLYFCVGDSPERMEMWRTLLGVKERQLLYLRGGQSELMSWIHCGVDLMVTTGASWWLPWWWVSVCGWWVSLQEVSPRGVTLQGARYTLQMGVAGLLMKTSLSLSGATSILYVISSVICVSPGMKTSARRLWKVTSAQQIISIITGREKGGEIGYIRRRWNIQRTRRASKGSAALPVSVPNHSNAIRVTIISDQSQWLWSICCRVVVGALFLQVLSE